MKLIIQKTTQTHIDRKSRASTNKWTLTCLLYTCQNKQCPTGQLNDTLPENHMLKLCLPPGSALLEGSGSNSRKFFENMDQNNSSSRHLSQKAQLFL